MSLSVPPPEPGRSPRLVSPGLWLFAPNRDCQGGSAWWLETPVGSVLVDCPAITEANLAFMAERAGVGGWIVLTGREGHGRLGRLQPVLPWPVLVQEQEAYLLPGLAGLVPFGRELAPAPGLRLLWTPGPSPGSCVLHATTPLAGDGLFCGRLLVPLPGGGVGPLRSRRSFHWPRQLASIERLCRWLPAGSPAWIASGAGLGALRGEALVGDGAARLAALERVCGDTTADQIVL
ncbi:MAG: MBL fold metallo-hydrolase [Cyanobacteriota bacterium]|nr:MBL fold metallo-hydrolase [Cyanobacteriota bacterium]